jgi:hypothetical protein
MCASPLRALCTRSRRIWALSRCLGRGLLGDEKGMVFHCRGCIEGIAVCGMPSLFSGSEWSSSRLNGIENIAELCWSYILRSVSFCPAGRVGSRAANRVAKNMCEWTFPRRSPLISHTPFRNVPMTGRSPGGRCNK